MFINQYFTADFATKIATSPEIAKRKVLKVVKILEKGITARPLFPLRQTLGLSE